MKTLLKLILKIILGIIRTLAIIALGIVVACLLIWLITSTDLSAFLPQ
jgi:hypothetical protein